MMHTVQKTWLVICMAVAMAVVPSAQALQGANVAIYSGYGTWADGITAVGNMLTTLGYTWEKVYADDLNYSLQDFAALYKVLIVPGGYAPYYNQNIYYAGKQRIRNFVSQGGGYFGICAGAYFACNSIRWEGVNYDDAAGYDLNLVPCIGVGSANDIADWNTIGYNMTGFRFNGNTAQLASYKVGVFSEQILYYGGPWFQTIVGGGVTTLGVYSSPSSVTGMPALVSSLYGSGRVVLIGPHPEIEEDSARDGVTIARENTMNDAGSDWPMTGALLKWLMKNDAAARAARWYATTPASFNADARQDLAVFYPANGKWYIQDWGNPAGAIVYDKSWGFSGARPVPADYDGDGVADLAVYYPTTGGWFIYSQKKNRILAWNFRWGTPGSLPVPADYNGDGRAEPAVYNPADGKWYIVHLATGNILAWARSWGFPGAVPVPGDYDGNGRADLAVYNLANGTWYVQGLYAPNSSIAWAVKWGFDGAIPVQRDYDGDGACDFGVYSPALGKWYVMDLWHNIIANGKAWGFSGGIPVAADYNGGGRADLGFYNPTTAGWFIYSLAAPTGAIAWNRQWGFGGVEVIGAIYY